MLRRGFGLLGEENEEHGEKHIGDILKGQFGDIREKVVSVAEHIPIGGELVHDIESNLSKTTEALRPTNLLKLPEKAVMAAMPESIAWRIRLGAAIARFFNWVRKPVDFVLRRIV